MITNRFSAIDLPQLDRSSEVRGADGVAGADNVAGVGDVGGASFADELMKAVGSVEQQSKAADVESTTLANGGGNIHETALALEKADVSMRLLLKARNKVVEAYQELSRMPV
ncbi:MAG TPA: flagellar hook-basal body complex protein FliE [Myxococcota bacterium]